MNTKQIKERINRMMQEGTLTPEQAVELMASVMSLIEVRALADDLTVAVVDKALSEIGEGKLPAEKAVELFDELRSMAEKEETKKAESEEKGASASSQKKSYAGEDLGDMFRGVTGEALEYAREQIELAREKLDDHGEHIRRKMEEKGFYKADGDVAQDRYTITAISNINGDLKTKITAVHGVLNLGGDLHAADSLKVTGKLNCGGGIFSGETDIHGTGRCGGDMKSGDLKVLGRLHCGGDLTTQELMMSGKTESGGDVHTKKIKVSGRFTCGGDMTASDIHLSGKIKCHGDLKGDTVYVSGRLLGDGDMRFGALTVEEPHEWVEWLTGGLIKDVEQIVCKGDLTVDGEVQARGRIVVEGKASFEQGTIEHLRARSVSLGPGVKARHVEYRDELVLAEGAEVQQPVQVS